MKRLFILFVLAGCMTHVIAQLNESDTAIFQLRVGMTGNHQQGNVEVLNIKGKLEFTFSPGKNWVIKSQNSSLYQAFYSVEADNDIFSRNYIYYKPQRKFYPFAIGYVSTNFRRKIKSRYFMGAGLTWQAINTRNVVLKFSASPVYESTRFKASIYNWSEYDGDNSIDTWRGTLYTSGWNYLLERRIRLYYDAYWQAGLRYRRNYRYQIDIGADLPVWRGLSFSLLYTFNHENVVVDNIKREDKLLTFGLAYNLKVKHR